MRRNQTFCILSRVCHVIAPGDCSPCDPPQPPVGKGGGAGHLGAKFTGAVLSLALTSIASAGTVIIAHRQDAQIGAEEFARFGAPVLNNASQLAFLGGFGTAPSGADTALFRGDEASVTMIAREGTGVTGFRQRVYDDFLAAESRSELVINDAGTVAWWARSLSTAQPPDDDWELIQYWRGSDDFNLVRTVAFTFLSAPDGNGAYASFNRRVGIAEFGAVIFHAAVDVADPSQSGSQGIFLALTEVPTTTYRVIRSGDLEFPGDVPIVLCGTVSACGEGFAYSDFGVVANYALLAPPDNRSRIHRSFVGGQPYAVGSELGNWDFSGLYMTGLGLRPSINNHSEVAFTAGVGGGSFSTSPSVILRKGSAAVIGADQVAMTDDPAPDGNGVLATLSRPIINDSSQVAFASTFWQTADPPHDDTGILLSTADVPSIVAREGDAAPGGGIFSDLNGAPFALGHAGVVAFAADLHGLPVEGRAIFLTNAIETLEVVRTGTPLLGSTIVDVEFAGDSARQGTGLNLHGEVAYRATLENGYEAVALFTPDAIWTAANSGDWDDPSNWRLGIVPAHPHDTYLDSGAPVAVQGPATSSSVRRLTFGPGAVSLVISAEARIQCLEEFEMSGDARLVLTIGGAPAGSAGRIAAVGDARLAGGFELVPAEGFTPVAGQVFVAVSSDAGAVLGKLEPMAGTIEYVVGYTGSAMNVTVMPSAGDLSALAGFADCMAGPGATPDPDGPAIADGCLTAFDGDKDGDVDLGDYRQLEMLLTSN